MRQRSWDVRALLVHEDGMGEPWLTACRLFRHVARTGTFSLKVIEQSATCLLILFRGREYSDREANGPHLARPPRALRLLFTNVSVVSDCDGKRTGLRTSRVRADA